MNNMVDDLSRKKESKKKEKSGPIKAILALSLLYFLAIPEHLEKLLLCLVLYHDRRLHPWMDNCWPNDQLMKREQQESDQTTSLPNRV